MLSQFEKTTKKALKPTRRSVNSSVLNRPANALKISAKGVSMQTVSSRDPTLGRRQMEIRAECYRSSTLGIGPCPTGRPDSTSLGPGEPCESRSAQHERQPREPREPRRRTTSPYTTPPIRSAEPERSGPVHGTRSILIERAPVQPMLHLETFFHRVDRDNHRRATELALDQG